MGIVGEGIFRHFGQNWLQFAQSIVLFSKLAQKLELNVPLEVSRCLVDKPDARRIHDSAFGPLVVRHVPAVNAANANSSNQRPVPFQSQQSVVFGDHKQLNLFSKEATCGAEVFAIVWQAERCVGDCSPVWQPRRPTLCAGHGRPQFALV
jgi:hypothetical protein